ncbi:MAG: hypothetical protein LLG00_14750, partial [Planctomycetaceae bacterium]|nr:hypothetical protein [Planctomycetaceae bacterium]
SVGWFAFLVFYLPAPNTSRCLPGAFLWFKVITTPPSIAAVGVLIWAPCRWWKVATSPLALLLVLAQLAAWTQLP